jgi:hypothetical protein
VPTIRRHRLTIASGIAAAVRVRIACGKDKQESSASTTTAAATGTTVVPSSAATVRHDEQVQQWLTEVGCNPGGVGGVIGPHTEAAIVEFQRTEGRAANGEMDAATTKALEAAAQAGKKVCGNTGTTAFTTTTGGQAPCTAPAPVAATPQGDMITGYVCADGHVGVTGTVGSGATSAFHVVLKSENGAWTNLGDEPCGAASAGIAPAVLEMGCPPEQG